MLGTDRTPNLDPMIIGIGVDVCDISRWEAAVQRHPGMVRKMLTHTEAVMPARSQAARFAAKEALYKALGGGEGLSPSPSSAPGPTWTTSGTTAPFP